MPTNIQTLNQSSLEAQAPSETTQMVSMIERMVMNTQVDALKLEKLMDLQERAMNRQAKEEFDREMADLQANMPAIPERGSIKGRDGKVQSTYALFEDMNDVMRPELTGRGFSITFRHAYEGDFLLVTGVLAHKGGHREETTIRLPHDMSGSKNAVQGVGSSVSYGKHYCMASLLNITTRGEDDDGKRAVQQKCITLAQVEALKQALGDPERIARFCESQGLDHLGEIAATDFDAAMAKIKRAGQKSAS